MTRALVLAGAANRPALLRWSQSPLRAAVRLYGRPVVEYVLEALLTAGEVAEVAVTGAPGMVTVSREVRRRVAWLAGAREAELAALWARDPVGEQAGSVSREVFKEPAAVAGEVPVLVVACDLPLLTPQAVDDFVRAAKAAGGDVVYPLVPQRAVAALGRGVGKPAMRTREGLFVGGNLAWLARPVPVHALSLLREVHRLRKRPYGLGRLLGRGAVVRMASGRMGVPEVEERLRRLTGIDVRLVPVEHGCLGLDLDLPRDHLAALRCLAQRKEPEGVALR